MKPVKLTLILLISYIALSASSNIMNNDVFTLDHSDLTETSITFNLCDYEIDDIIKNGEHYSRIICEGGSDTIEPGKPELPRFTHLIAIPDEGEVQFQITDIDQEVIDNIKIIPSMELQSESRLSSTEFTIDDEFYRNGSLYPFESVIIGDPVILRDLRLISVTINPFRFDPKTDQLHVVKNLQVNIITSGRGGINVKDESSGISRYFESIYKSTVLNYEVVQNRNSEYQNPSYLFISPNNTTVQTYLQPLLDWKHEKGFIVNSVNTLETGSNSNQILNYITNAYENWDDPPEFVCLVGDAGGSFNIPTGHYNGGEGDHFYTMLEGNDILSDIFIGRLSFNTTTEFQTILTKIFSYEKNPYLTTTDWYEKAVLIGDPSSSGTSTIDTKIHVKDMILANCPNFECAEVYSGGYTNYMTQNINSGVSYFNYRGFGGMSGWNNGHINSLTNGFMLPVAIGITCNTGDFEGTYDCISEAFLKAGTPSLPRGAIAAVSTATGQTHTCFNNCMDAGIYYGLFSDSLHFTGGGLNRGKLNLYINYPDNPNNQVTNFSYWNNLMGDPGLELWTGVPEPLNVIYDPEIPNGTNFMEILVENSSGEPLKDAWVTLLKGDDEIFETALTDDSGSVILPLDQEQSGEVILTVTRHNFIPHSGTFELIQEEQFVNISEMIIDDDNFDTSAGNDDGFANPGEDLELKVSLQNFGSLQVSGVSAVLSSSDPYITVSDNEEYYGDIAGSSIISSDDDFDIHISEAAPGGYVAVLNFTITDDERNQWTDLIYLQIAGALITAESCEVIDSDNNIFDPGETAQLSLTISNSGLTEADDIYGTISCLHSHIDIVDPDGYFGSIASGETASNQQDLFELTASSHLISGAQIPFSVDLYNSAGFSQTVSFILNIGEITIVDPLGPDVFGYYCYDNDDLSYLAPEYAWIEISPDLGGPGTALPLNDWGNTGDTEDIDLPFTLTFYDVDYNSASVSSNGWICPGQTNSESFMNWSIPGPLGPSPLIAPFWDDLMTGDGEVSHYFDPDLHWFIIEWNNMQNQYNYSEETFQVIIYDQNYYPTANGNNEILIQYKTVNNVDQGQYGGWSVEHGLYATVGIEDHLAERGLQYTFNNEYPAAAKRLEDETALLFTGPPIYQEEPFLVIGIIELDDENGNSNADYGESIDLYINLSNLGNNTATGVTAQLSGDQEHLTIVGAESAYPEIPGGSQQHNSTPFNLQIHNDCPDGQVAQFNLLVSSSEQDWDLNFSLVINAPQIQFNSLLVNDGENNILDPGETSDLLINLLNLGGASATNGLFTISTSEEALSINEGSFEVSNLNPESSTNGILNVTVSEDAFVGQQCLIDWNFSSDYEYSNSGQFNLVVSQIPVDLEEHFEEFPPTGWSISENSNWTQGTWNQAGGESPEAQFNWYPQNSGYQRLMTMPINTLGSLTLELEFKHSVSHFTGDYDLLIQTSSDGDTWNTAHSFPASDIASTTEILTLSTMDVGQSTFQLAFCFSGDSYNINNWWIDDVILTSSSAETYGYLSGNVQLTGGDGDPERVMIRCGDYAMSPDTEGNYILPLPAGIYTATAALPGYTTDNVVDIEIIALESTIVDFELTYLNPPVELSAEVVENDVYLDWEMQVRESLSEQNDPTENITITLDKKDVRLRTISGFNVYRNSEIIQEILDPEDMSYIDHDLANGEFSYYVTAQYEEGESDPTEEISVIIDFNDADPNLIPNVTTLLGNHPNPFNPVTTISFQLADGIDLEDVILTIHNIKGQKIRTFNCSKNTFPVSGDRSRYSVIWDGKSDKGITVSSGIYLYSLKANGYFKTDKMILLR